MTSRVIHTRLSDNTLVGCYDFLKAADFPIEGKAVASIVRIAMETFIETLRTQGEILTYECQEDASNQLDAYIVNNVPEAPVSLAGLRQTLSLRDDVEDPPEMGGDSIRAAIDRVVSNRVTPDISLDDPEEVDAPEGEESSGKVPWEGVPRTPLSELKKVAPKDRFIEVAEDDAVVQKAVEIVYKALPVDMWGSPRAGELLKETIAVIEPFRDLVEATEGG